MSRFLLMPYFGNWIHHVEAKNHEMAYRLHCNWYREDTKIAVMDEKTGITKIFHREGFEVIEEKANEY